MYIIKRRSPLETGATYSLISLDTSKKISDEGNIEKCDIILCAYDKRLIKVVRKAKINVQYKAIQFLDKIIIVQEPLETILGCNWIFKLNLSMGEINQIPMKSINGIIENFQDVY